MASWYDYLLLQLYCIFLFVKILINLLLITQLILPRRGQEIVQKYNGKRILQHLGFRVPFGLHLHQVIPILYLLPIYFNHDNICLNGNESLNVHLALSHKATV